MMSSNYLYVSTAMQFRGPFEHGHHFAVHITHNCACLKQQLSTCLAVSSMPSTDTHECHWQGYLWQVPWLRALFMYVCLKKCVTSFVLHLALASPYYKCIMSTSDTVRALSYLTGTCLEHLFAFAAVCARDLIKVP